MLKWEYWNEEKTLVTVYSDDPKKKLRQVETSLEYESATDVIIGYRKEVPYGRFTYEEIDKRPEEMEGDEENAIQHVEEEG